MRVRLVEVLAPGPLTLFQDHGRPGHASWGISPSGAADRTAFNEANRLAGNSAGAVALETTFGGLEVRAVDDVLLAVTGAACAGAPHRRPFVVRAGEVVRLSAPRHGVRSYIAIRGGWQAETVLGSSATDLLSGIGPAPVAGGDILRSGRAIARAPSAAEPELPGPPDGSPLALLPGPRTGWLDDQARRSLTEQTFTASAQSNRVAVRLEGPELGRRAGELPSEGLVRGAVQLPPSGRPVIFLADHPVSGGYPIVAYLSGRDADRCAQLAPGDPVGFAWSEGLTERG